LGGAIGELDRFDAVICVSGHAVRFVLERIDAAWKQRPDLTWIAVGAATARALADHGVAALRPVIESSEGILALAPLNRVVGKRVLICAGRGGRPLLAAELARRGADVTTAALYQRVAVASEHAARQLGDASAIGAVIVSSADGARAFAPVWRAVGGDDRVAIVAPSARVAVELNGLGFQRVMVADGAGASATIEALSNLDEGWMRDRHE
jgi:uroporphyrinogen-III synthase